jgi:hypothetical protein
MKLFLEEAFDMTFVGRYASISRASHAILVLQKALVASAETSWDFTSEGTIRETRAVSPH